MQEAPFGKYLMDLNYHQLHVMYQLSYDVACLLKAIGMPKNLVIIYSIKESVVTKGYYLQYQHNRIFKLEAKINRKARFIYFAECKSIY